jgi:hypothetical protein
MANCGCKLLTDDKPDCDQFSTPPNTSPDYNEFLPFWYYEGQEEGS